MSAVDLSAGGGFAQLARAFVDLQAQEFLPLLPAAGVSDVKGALASTGALLLAGVPEEVLLRLGAWRPEPAGPSRDPTAGQATGQLARPPCASGLEPLAVQSAEPSQAQRVRSDIPVRRDGRRALQAALPENQRESLADLDGAIMARSSEGPFQSRVRTWVDFTASWALPAWPITLDAGRPAPSASHPALCQGGRPGLGGVQAESHLPGGAAGASLGSLAGVCGGALEPLVRGPRGGCPPPGGLVYAAGDRVRGGPDRGHRSRRGPVLLRIPCTRRRRGESGSSRRGSFAALAGSSLCPCARRMRP